MKLGVVLFIIAGLNVVLFAGSVISSRYFKNYIDFDSVTIHSFLVLPIFIILVVIGSVVSAIESSADLVLEKEKEGSRSMELTKNTSSIKEVIVSIIMVVFAVVILASLISIFLFGRVPLF